MSFDQVNSSYRGGRQLSSTQKKEILWNIIEPGDPYDIKRYSGIYIGPWSRRSQATAITLWASILSLFVSCRLPKSNACANTWKNISSGEFKLIQISRNRAQIIGPPLLRNPDKGTDSATKLENSALNLKSQTQRFPQKADCIHLLTQAEL